MYISAQNRKEPCDVLMHYKESLAQNEQKTKIREPCEVPERTESPRQ